MRTHEATIGDAETTSWTRSFEDQQRKVLQAQLSSRAAHCVLRRCTLVRQAAIKERRGARGALQHLSTIKFRRHFRNSHRVDACEASFRLCDALSVNSGPFASAVVLTLVSEGSAASLTLYSSNYLQMHCARWRALLWYISTFCASATLLSATATGANECDADALCRFS